MLLLFGNLSVRIGYIVRKYYSSGYTIDCPVDGIKTLFGCFPLFYSKYRLVCEFRGYYTKALSREIIALSFEDIEYKETHILSLSGQRGGGTQNAKRLNKR